MSASHAFLIVCWNGGVLLGLGLGISDVWFVCGGMLLSVLAFTGYVTFGEGPGA